MHIDNYFVFAAEIIGVMAFAISGAMVAINKGLDVMGVLVLTVITCLFGGVLRDLTLGITPPNLFWNPVYFIYSGVAVAIGIACFIIASVNKRRDYIMDKTSKNKLLHISDAIGLGVFCISGVNMAISRGFFDAKVVCIFAGCISGIGGSMMRDILVNEIPILFRKYIYIIPTIIGTTVYILIYKHVATTISFIIGVGIIIVIRVLAIFFNWNLPPVRENPSVTKPHF